MLLCGDGFLLRTPPDYFSAETLRPLLAWVTHFCCTVTTLPWRVDTKTATGFCRLVVVADEKPLCLKAVLLNFSRDAGSSLGVAALGLSSRAGGGAQVFPMAPPVLPQDKVVVGSGAHGIEYIGFVGNQELWVRKRTIYFHLAHFCLIAVFLRITCRAIFRNASILNPFRENDSIIGSSELFSSWDFKP